ncbi:MAG: TlpA disulfide reductase family protein [Candidatus Firestonebacteria bacterium]
MKKIIIFLTILSFFAMGMSKKSTETETKELENSSSEKKAPDFSLKDLSGKQVNLKDFTDKKVVLLLFWTTWCGYCVQEIPELKKLQEEFKDKDLEILAINIKESKEKVESFVSKKGIKYIILLDDGAVAKKYNVVGIPTNVIIDKNGNIKSYGDLPSIDFIEKIIKE